MTLLAGLLGACSASQSVTAGNGGPATGAEGRGPVLGVPWGYFQSGYGQQHPAILLNGGDGEIDNIHWTSWGSATAAGHGAASWAYAANREPVNVVAFDPGNCRGIYAYTAFEWYFPRHGQAFDPHTYINVCTWQYVSGGHAGAVSSSHLTAAQSAAAALARRIAPSVVDINSTYQVRLGGKNIGVKLEATGIIIASSGLVLADSIYARKATSISVAVSVPSQGKIFRATVLGADRKADITLLGLLGASGLTPIKLGGHTRTKTGEKCIELGLGLNMPSAPGGWLDYIPGKITAANQTVQPTGTSPTLAGVLQTSAPTSQIFEGGPLVDTAGHVIGLNLSASTLYPAQGFPGFAIPIDRALSIAHRILGAMSRGKS